MKIRIKLLGLILWLPPIIQIRWFTIGIHFKILTIINNQIIFLCLPKMIKMKSKLKIKTKNKINKMSNMTSWQATTVLKMIMIQLRIKQLLILLNRLNPFCRRCKMNYCQNKANQKLYNKIIHSILITIFMKISLDFKIISTIRTRLNSDTRWVHRIPPILKTALKITQWVLTYSASKNIE